MPRIVGIDIPDNKRLEIALTYIFGVGKSTSQQIIKMLRLDPNMRARDLTQEHIGQINALLQSEFPSEGEKRREVQNAIKHLISIHTYRGMRHRTGLPVRGQRTSTNARTRKGRKKTVAGKKK